ncbi:hypothetical protein J2755_001361 [Methanohalophilus levihalophilus]|uniref:COG1361 S-layer family protein n=1 Tax=Methanohalophilus levihalophilus TaxID=1431282 RepID=UPI001AE75B17|nr:hypothetical protein [Methanohalophilus levihalophilus]MBP2030427.1 hypothetical protein [Methanohalophilus levihalophilus]
MRTIRNYAKQCSFAIMVLALLLTVAASAQEESVNAGLPEHFSFDENYYTVYGGPDVVATLVGDNEFARGDTVTLNVNLMNKGVLTGFRSETDDDDLDTLEQKLQQAEMSYESQRTTAIGIVAIMTSSDPNIRVKSGPQEAGTLMAGEQTDSPVQFVIEISKNAEAGEYPLLLNLYYGFQRNVQVDGDNETDLGITNMQVGLWYDVGAQNVTVPVYVEEEAKFAVTNVTGILYANEENMLYVTYSNVGELTAKDAIVRMSPAEPFSTTDDQAYLGDLKPGESSVAAFRLKVDENAVFKSYAINSEIKYEDSDGHDRISDAVKIQTEVLPGASSGGNSSTMLGGLAVILLAVGGFVLYRKRSGTNSESEE